MTERRPILIDVVDAGIDGNNHRAPPEDEPDAQSTLTSARPVLGCEKQKTETGRDLRAAALQLFASQGYEATDVSTIAKLAGMSTRRFIRFFPTKESLLYYGEADWLSSLFDAYASQPVTLDDLSALCATLIELAPRAQKARRLLLLYQRSVEISMALRGHDQRHRLEASTALAYAVGRRRGLLRPDDRCTLVADIALAVYHRSLALWLSGQVGTDLVVVIGQEFDILRGQLTRESK